MHGGLSGHEFLRVLATVAPTERVHPAGNERRVSAFSSRGLRRSLIVTVGAASSLCMLAPGALAHGLTAHENNPVTILWEQDGVEDGSTNHNHCFNHDIRDPDDEMNHHSHDSFSAWHNRTLVVLGNLFFHGFIDEGISEPRYKFGTIGANSRALGAEHQSIINEAFNLWESEAHASGAIPGRRTGIGFTNNNSPFEFQIVFMDELAECRAAAGSWIVFAYQLLANTEAEENGCSVASGMAWTDIANLDNGPILMFDDDLLWETLGIGVPSVPGSLNFATIAIHETGHVVGLLHTPGDHVDHIMRASIVDQALDVGFDEIEKDSAVGAAELYTVGAVPEVPGLSWTGVLLLVGGLLVLSIRANRVVAANLSTGPNGPRDGIASR